MFFGREQDIQELLALWNKRVSSLITCRGRRRIGKSTLIKEFARKSKARLIQLEGVRPRKGLSNEDELRHFSQMLAVRSGTENSLPENWLVAFKRLGEQIHDNERTVILLDEMFTDVITAQLKFSGDVLRCLVDGPRTVSEVAARLGVERGGNVSKAMARLEEAGFVSPDHGKNPETGAEIRERRFRLCDNYARFYLKYIEPAKDLIDGGGFSFISLKSLNGWPVIKGLAFENLVINHYPEFAGRLGLSNTLIVSAAPYVKHGNRERGVAGCQVDFLVQSENMMCLVEIKRQKEIGAEVVAEMEEKVAAIGRRPGVTIRTALVYSGCLDPTVAVNGYFNAIVDVGEVM